MKRTNSFELPPIQEDEIEKNKSSEYLDQKKSSKLQNRSSKKSDAYHSMKKNTIEPRRVTEVQINEISLKKVQTEKLQPSLGGARGPKVPLGLVESIRKRATGRRPKAHESMLKTSKFMNSKIKEIRDMFTCPICECQYNKEDKSILCDCPHEYCDSCLQHYVIYKVGIFEEVVCPDEECDIIMNMELRFFRDLPEDIRKKYKKVHAFYITSKDPTLRLCPSENCQEGILKLIENINPKCDACGETFCEKCFFKVHEGPCQGKQIEFFENNLHYRQCSSCKNVIEKSQGCNHMTCRCGYQFCYVCGTKWLGYDHICPQNPNQNQNQNQNPPPVAAVQNNRDDCLCCDRQLCCGFPRCLGKTFIVFPIILVLFILRTLKMLLLMVIFFIAAIFTGMCPAACQILDRSDNCFCTLLMLIFFPFLMIAGIFIMIREIFSEAGADECGAYCDDVGELLQCLCD